MALPSQSARPIARRNNMYRRAGRRKKSSRGWLLLPIVAVVALLAWRFWPDGAGPSGEPTFAANEPAVIGDDERQRDEPFPIDAGSNGGADHRPQVLATPTERLMPPARTDTGQPPAVEMGSSSTTPPDDDGRNIDNRDAPLMPRQPEPTADPRGVAHPTAGDGAIDARLQAGMDLLARNQLVQGRAMLSEALLSGRLTAEDEQWARDRLSELNERMVFSPEVVPADPFVITYSIQSGDALSRLPRKLGLQVDWRLIQRINRIAEPHRIRVGQRLKLVTGPFHAVVDKTDYRMDILLGEGRDRVYVCSFPIGLGEYNSTPVGRFRVKGESKLVNPQWTNPRTRQLYQPDDPANPIGEYWIGLEGAEEHLEQVDGYGIHGTIEPESIGRQSSMGCVRMRADDIALVYGMLIERVSTVTIRP
jgi:hypothetical protein